MTDTDVRTERPPLVLVANDQEWSARTLESILGPQGYAVIRAYTGASALDLARSTPPDVVLLDARLPDLDGVDVCRALRADPRIGAHTPIVITTSGPAERRDALAALEAGAWDYLGHPLDGELLLLRLDTFLQAKRAVDREREERLLDEITGLYNVRGLARRAREIGAEAHRMRAPLTCIAFAAESSGNGDDAVLEERAAQVALHLTALLRATGRSSDAIGRLGLSEFAIIAPATVVEGAARIIERIQLLLAERPLPLDGVSHPIRIRAGYSAAPDYAESRMDAVEMLLQAAASLRAGRPERAGRREREESVRYVH